MNDIHNLIITAITEEISEPGIYFIGSCEVSYAVHCPPSRRNDGLETPSTYIDRVYDAFQEGHRPELSNSMETNEKCKYMFEFSFPQINNMQLLIKEKMMVPL